MSIAIYEVTLLNGLDKVIKVKITNSFLKLYPSKKQNKKQYLWDTDIRTMEGNDEFFYLGIGYGIVFFVNILDDWLLAKNEVKTE